MSFSIFFECISWEFWFQMCSFPKILSFITISDLHYRRLAYIIDRAMLANIFRSA
jgi:hypothetical protein